MSYAIAVTQQLRYIVATDNYEVALLYDPSALGIVIEAYGGRSTPEDMQYLLADWVKMDAEYRAVMERAIELAQHPDVRAALMPQEAQLWSGK